MTKSPASENNRDRIFIAAKFLKERIQLLVQGNTELHNAEITKDNISIRCLAGDLHNFCPELQGVNPEALADLFRQIIKAKRCLDAHLVKVSPSGPPVTFTPTVFSTIAGELVELDDTIQKAKDAWETVNKNNKRSRAPVPGSQHIPLLRPATAPVLPPLQHSSSVFAPFTYMPPLQTPPALALATLLGQVSPLSNNSEFRPTSALGSTRTTDPAPDSEKQSTKILKMEQLILRMQTQQERMLTMLETQQETIEELQKRLKTTESDLVTSKEDQRALEKCLLIYKDEE